MNYSSCEEFLKEFDKGECYRFVETILLWLFIFSAGISISNRIER